MASMDVMASRGVALPIMLSVTVSDLAGRTLSGQTLDAFLASISNYPIFSVGLNCSFGAQQMKPYLRQLAQRAPYYVSAYPNAGLPNSLGLYDETPESMAALVAEFVDEGLVNIIGGCCGTTEQFIRLFPALVEGKAPRKPAPRPATMRLSGLDVLDVSPEVRFVNVGERCNVAGSRKFLRLVSERNFDEALAIARKQVADGALVIDINMDDGLIDARSSMVTFLNMLSAEPDIARVPVMIDSSDWEVVKAGLKCMQGKCIVNSISLKEGEETFVAHALDVMRYGAAVVVMCFDEQGQATTYDRRIEIAARAYRLLTETVGMNPLDIIFDPNVLAVAGMEEHDSYAADFIRAVAWIRANLPGAHVSGGVSNLSFSFRGNNYIREAMHAVFLYHAIQIGMDFGIVNPAAKVTYSDIPADELQVIEDVILRAGARGGRQARRAGRGHQGAPGVGAVGSRRRCRRRASMAPSAAGRASVGSPCQGHQRLYGARPSRGTAGISVGRGHYRGAADGRHGQGGRTLRLRQDVSAAGGESSQDDEGRRENTQSIHRKREGRRPLCRGQGAAGHGKGRCARHWQEHSERYHGLQQLRDCGHGVMVPAEQIVKKAKEEHVDLIGLSGLITPSLDEMVNVARQLAAAGVDVPLMIGGATTSKLHVALKVAPVYGGPVVWLKDASQNVLVAGRLLSASEHDRFVGELNSEYEALRRDYAEKQAGIVPLDEARSKRLNLFAD